MGSGLHTTDAGLIRANQERDRTSDAQGDAVQGRPVHGQAADPGMPASVGSNGGGGSNGTGGAEVPGDTPTEAPASNRDPGNEMPAPRGGEQPVPEEPSPTPAPSEVPHTGPGTPHAGSGPADLPRNSPSGGPGLGNVVNLSNMPGENVA